MPYFNKNTVKEVVDELQNTEGGEIPTVIDSESLENQVYVQWSVHPPKQKKAPIENPYEPNLFSEATQENSETTHAKQNFVKKDTSTTDEFPSKEIHLQQEQTVIVSQKSQSSKFVYHKTALDSSVQDPLPSLSIDREAIIKFINNQGYLTYLVRIVKINNYLKSLLKIAIFEKQ